MTNNTIENFVCVVRVDLPENYDAVSTQSPEALKLKLENLIAKVSAGAFHPENVKNAVRDMLRVGGFKPAGRQKPSSEYLIQAAINGNFPFINAAVDCNNFYSLFYGLPISLLDADVVGPAPRLRFGDINESYIFNASGQVMDIAGLLSVCNADDKPLGNPVKDSMQGKIQQNTKRLAGFIYIPSLLYTEQQSLDLGRGFEALLCEFCGAKPAADIKIMKTPKIKNS